MKHIAAALLLSLSGKEITEKGINEIIGSVGGKADPRVVSLIVAATKGKKPEQIIAEGLPKLSSTVGAVSAPVSGAPAEKGKADEKKGKVEPKKKEEPKEEEEEIGFGDLF